jgi:cytochrome c oxidase subunit 2
MSDWPQSVLEAAGPQAARLLPLWRFMLVVSVLVFALVIGALLWATFRRRRAEPPSERGMTRTIVGATALTVIVLFVFLVLDFTVGRALARPPRPGPVVSVTGHQWWWEIEYDDSLPQRRVRTANELHVPVGQPVIIRLLAADVIHSFWVPSLAGKVDQIPGRQNRLWLQADTPGVYRGACAEFCGHQHAKMALVVIAEPPENFARWYEAQLAPAAAPADPSAARGQRVFVEGRCAACHAVEGTPAGSNVGPVLTHLASRLTLGAGALLNTRGNLAGWVVDPQQIKPGARMPPSPLPPADLQALLDYLGTLR